MYLGSEIKSITAGLHLTPFSVFANPVRTSTRPQTSSKAFGIISGLFGGILTKETHILPKNSPKTAGTSSTQKCLFWGILANLVHRVGGWILIFSQNEYDFRNQHPKNVQKQLVQVENRKKGRLCPPSKVMAILRFWDFTGF